MRQCHRCVRPGFTIREAATALVIAVVIMSILLPSLQRARVESRRAVCQSQLVAIGSAWFAYLEDHDQTFPPLPGNVAWRWGGTMTRGEAAGVTLDPERPFNAYLPRRVVDEHGQHLCKCPADCGLDGSSSTFETFGTSYRANSALFDTRSIVRDDTVSYRGLRRRDITTAPSRLLVLGDPVWYEVIEDTGRHAVWHGDRSMGNFLFLDGSVRYGKVYPRGRVGPIVVDPFMAGERRAMTTPTSAPADSVTE